MRVAVMEGGRYYRSGRRAVGGLSLVLWKSFHIDVGLPDCTRGNSGPELSFVKTVIRPCFPRWLRPVSIDNLLKWPFGQEIYDENADSRNGKSVPAPAWCSAIR
jgi:hypothetical protein